MVEWMRENPGYTFVLVWIICDSLVRIAQAFGGKCP